MDVYIPDYQRPVHCDNVSNAYGQRVLKHALILLFSQRHNLYPVEILSLPLRAKGMGLYGVIQGAAGAIEAYGISIGISKVGYKIWVVYIAYNCLQLVGRFIITLPR